MEERVRKHLEMGTEGMMASHPDCKRPDCERPLVQTTFAASSKATD